MSAKYFISLVFAASAIAAPPRPPIERRAEGTPPQFAYTYPTVTAYGPTSASGQLYGPTALGGYQPGDPVNLKAQATVPENDFQLAPDQSEPADLGLYIDLSTVKNPQPIRGSTDGPTDPGPRNIPLDRENSDLFAPPGTDSGNVPNAKWPMGLSHNRHGTPQTAGWARQQNVDVLPIATQMAGVDMYLSPNSYRELHWHQEGEWAIVLNGSARLNAMNEAGQSFVDDVTVGDVWFFPAGIPHSIQAHNDGCEFLIVFDSGDFSEDNTFLVSELFERNPKAVLAKDLQVDTSAFDHIPDGQLWIFNGTATPSNISESNVTGPGGMVPMSESYTYHFSQQEAYEVPGGSVKILDTQTFPIARDFAVALFTIKPGAMRELHWHTTSDEWDYVIQGKGRLTAYVAPSAGRTFDFQAGDTGYVPVATSHYMENVGTEDLIYLEVLQAPIYNDISVAQWLGLTPKQIVKDHLGFSDDTLDRLPKIKPYILPGNTNMSTTDFTVQKPE